MPQFRKRPTPWWRKAPDLLYHLMVLWAEQGITPGQIYTELGKRVGVSGLTEKAARANKGKPD